MDELNSLSQRQSFSPKARTEVGVNYSFATKSNTDEQKNHCQKCEQHSTSIAILEEKVSNL